MTKVQNSKVIEGKDELGYYSQTHGSKFYHHMCLDCTLQFDCHYNLIQHRKIIHDDFTNFGGTIGVLECTK